MLTSLKEKKKSGSSWDKRSARVKRVLERLYEKYNRRHLIKPDPLQFVYRYSEDREKPEPPL
ncbi:MAG: hypothetical protein ACYS74_05510 [Planctomycetota bacterium]|jgi:hypothetical protein